MFQDSKGSPSWLNEALQMDKVYAHSVGNIAASCARTTNEGMFRTRVLDHIILQLPHHSVEGWESTSLPAKFVVKDEHIKDDFTLAPLRQRAWAVQERFLAPELLYFAQREITWECKMGFAPESRPSLKDGNSWCTHGFDTTFKKTSNVHAVCALNCQQADGCSVVKAWKRVSQSYSAGALTRADDRLIALAGMAKYFAPYFDSAYLAGLWERHLPFLLLWNAKEPLRPSRPATYRAPSFFWFAIDAEIAYTNVYYSTHCLDAFEILEVQMRSAEATGDPFGPVKGGHMRMRTRLRRFRVHFPKETRFGIVFSPCNQHLTKPGGTVSLDVEDDIANATGPDGVFVMMANAEPRHWYEGIVLSCTDTSQGRFRRLGHLTAGQALRKQE